MQVRALVPEYNGPDLSIDGLANDSRKVSPGDAFLAYRGTSTDGHLFVQEAVARGARAIFAEHPAPTNFEIPWVQVDDLVQRQSAIAGLFFGDPSKSMTCVGITGTNGKTSIAYALADLMENTGFAGSLGWGQLSQLQRTGLTTMDAISVQAGLAGFLKEDINTVAMEVSSHALAQCRVDAVEYDVAVFTNLTRDHLDFHGTMQAYGDAKAKLFDFPSLSTVVVNVDDEFGKEICHRIEDSNVTQYRIGLDREANVSWHALDPIEGGFLGTFDTPWGKSQFNIPVQSEYYIANSAATLASMIALGLPFDEAIDRLERLRTPPGRMEVVHLRKHVSAVIDYAHTPDALETALRGLRARKPNRLMCVFGCGGDRDRGKRALMGAVVERLADYAIVTTDNPRTEEPESIIDEIATGFSSKKSFEIQVDRVDAIVSAVSQSEAGDIILIAGKGSENYIEAQGQHIPHSDRSVVLEFV